MSIEDLRKYKIDSAKELSFIGSSLVRLSSAISGGLVLSGHPFWSLITIALAWLGHEMQEYFKLHEVSHKKDESIP